LTSDGAHVRHLVVHGRVQGVFFRASTERQAERHGVTGWARNDPDGTLEVWLEGPRDGVEAVERWIRGGGPPAARVERVEVDEPDPEGFGSFAVRH
jgi:acylphosphatase